MIRDQDGRAPGVFGMFGQSLQEQREGGPKNKGLQKVHNDMPASAPASSIGAPSPTPAQKIKAHESDDTIYVLDPDDISPWEFADRPDEEFGDLNEITESIRAHGQETPALVRPGKIKGKYELIYGRRRWTVCRDLGIKLKTFIKALTDKEAFQKMYLENSSRQDLSAWARALSYRRAIDKGLYSSESALAAHLGIHRASLSNIMALNRLPQAVIQAVGPGMSNMSVKSAKAILSVCKDPESIERVVSLADKIAEGTIGGDNIIKAVEKTKKVDSRDTKIVTTPEGKKLFSCRVTGRGMTEVMFYPEAVRDIPQEELLNKIKGLLSK